VELPLAIGHRPSVNRSTKASRSIIRGASRGLVYPILLLGILILGIATAGVAQVWSTQVKREKEADLLFRLGEIRQAIARYRTDHNRLPKELKDLLEDRTQLAIRRYLRRIYPDPMTGKPDWKPDLLADRAGVVAGIQDVHSQSNGKPLKVLVSTKPINSYQDW
jgi:type II secretory pathway pseudopilin PulG